MRLKIMTRFWIDSRCDACICFLIITGSRWDDKLCLNKSVKFLRTKLSFNNIEKHNYSVWSGPWRTSPLSAVQAVISFLHGLTFPSLLVWCSSTPQSRLAAQSYTQPKDRGTTFLLSTGSISVFTLAEITAASQLRPPCAEMTTYDRADILV